MTVNQISKKRPGIESFVIKYQIITIIICVLLLLYFPYDFLSPAFNANQTYRGIGRWIDDSITYLAVPIGWLIYTRKVNKAYKQKLAVADSKQQ